MITLFLAVTYHSEFYQVGQVTMDNASNNNTMMEELERELTKRGISFHRDGNRIRYVDSLCCIQIADIMTPFRCFPHVINLAVQAFLVEMKRSPSWPLDHMPDNTTDDMYKYTYALNRDLISTTRNIVSACRASGQRRRSLRKVIQDGNATGYWVNKILPDGEWDKMPEVQLLRDSETRWSSTFLMIRRLLLLYPVRRPL